MTLKVQLSCKEEEVKEGQKIGLRDEIRTKKKKSKCKRKDKKIGRK